MKATRSAPSSTGISSSNLRMMYRSSRIDSFHKHWTGHSGSYIQNPERGGGVLKRVVPRPAGHGSQTTNEVPATVSNDLSGGEAIILPHLLSLYERRWRQLDTRLKW